MKYPGGLGYTIKKWKVGNTPVDPTGGPIMKDKPRSGRPSEMTARLGNSFQYYLFKNILRFQQKIVSRWLRSTYFWSSSRTSGSVHKYLMEAVVQTSPGKRILVYQIQVVTQNTEKSLERSSTFLFVYMTMHIRLFMYTDWKKVLTQSA